MSNAEELDANRCETTDLTKKEPVLNIIEQPVAAAETVSHDPSPPTSREASTIWKANPNLLTRIVDFGYSAICAEKALFHTGNSSADRAVGWILDHPDCQDDSTPLQEQLGLSSSSESSVDMYKMVFVVNSSLKMGIGKIAAQVGHATLSLYKRLETAPFRDAVSSWADSGEMKIVLRGDDEQHLVHLAEMSRQAGFPCYLVHDAGRTQVPSGSATVLSIFGASQQLDAITGNLKLM